jgi:hypothetical protein
VVHAHLDAVGPELRDQWREEGGAARIGGFAGAAQVVSEDVELQALLRLEGGPEDLDLTK